MKSISMLPAILEATRRGRSTQPRERTRQHALALSRKGSKSCRDLLSRYEYQNAKAVLRAVANGIEAEKLSKDILPDLNEINTPWIKILESSDDLRSAAQQMRRKSFGSALTNLQKMLASPTMRMHWIVTTSRPH